MKLDGEMENKSYICIGFLHVPGKNGKLHFLRNIPGQHKQPDGDQTPYLEFTYY